MKVVMDSNILIAAMGKRSNLRPIWDAFIEGKFQLVVSEDILKEYEEIMQEHAAPGVAELVMEILVESPDVLFQHVYYNWSAIVADPEDDKFFDIAVASNSDYLVTNDKHFNIVKKMVFPVVKVIDAVNFQRLIT